MAAISYTPEQRAQAASKQAAAPLDSVDRGVTVALSGERYLISFPFSPVLIAKVKAIGSAFDSDQKAHVVPAAEYDAVKKTVESMRVLRAAMVEAKAEIMANPAVRFEGAKVSSAMTAGGNRMSGKVLAANEHYVAQANGQKDGTSYVVIHERGALESTRKVDARALQVGQDVSVLYRDGKGLVYERSQTASKGIEQAKAPAAAPAAPAEAKAVDHATAPAKAARAARPKKSAQREAGPTM